ncbi:hypothetical protein [Cryobacterium sp. Hh7]|uniref:hypothetical protein n=1 Tax=Cryobacterium sp. Hh7 TaxID=1259159 RepID=UPI00141B93B7|nr:hypothetical protein [Cryobacterium sp. Hh7]
MTAAHWVHFLLVFGVIFIFIGCWLLWPLPITFLGFAFMAPMVVLAFIQIKDMQ